MSSMRGLTVFISDLRNARARDLEEKRINTELAKIRARFRDVKLSGYDRKKYVCKLLYMYILGWAVNFGHLEAVTLISSTKYSEKQIGYLGVTLFLNENHELLHLVVNSIRKDLLDSNELHNCLALHCIANIGGIEMGSTLSNEVHQLLVSGTSRPFVKKKAALTLLRLYRKSSGIIEPSWIQKLISLMDDPDMGVALSVVSLISVLAQDQPQKFSFSYQRAVQRLKAIVIDGEYGSEYLYYKIACPWLQIKLMRHLLIFQPPADELLRDLLVEILERIIQSSEIIPKNIQQSNAQNAILFQAIDLAIHIEVNQDLTTQIIRLLGRFLKSKETNIRYLGLETLSRLTGRSDVLRTLKGHRSIVSQSLKDRDLSVRRRALDLLYYMCDTENARELILELVQHLQISDHAIREEMVLKIAILVEKFSTAYDWYITVTLQLLAIAGEHVADEVWQRVIQVVANNEVLQAQAARSVLSYMRGPSCHENLVKVAGFVLGEFGHLIANEEACSPIEQFSAMHTKFNIASPATRAMLLTTYVKFLNIFPEIKPELILVFQQFKNILDAELQQRACEYLALSVAANEDLLQAVCEEMPPFPEKASRLISKLYSRESEHAQPVTVRTRKALDSNTLLNTTRQPDITEHVEERLHLSTDWEIGFLRLVWKANGILYENDQMRILLRSDYNAHKGSLTLCYYNKSNTPYLSFTTVLCSAREELSLRMLGLVPTMLEPRSQVQQTFQVDCLEIFLEAPRIRVVYFAGSLQEIVLKLPVVLDKFLVPSRDIKFPMFKAKWADLESPSLASRNEISIDSSRLLDPSRLTSIVDGHHWGMVIDGTTSNTILAASIIHLQAQKIGCLLQLVWSDPQGSIRIEVRASVPIVADLLQKALTRSFATSLAMAPR